MAENKLKKLEQENNDNLFSISVEIDCHAESIERLSFMLRLLIDSGYIKSGEPVMNFVDRVELELSEVASEMKHFADYILKKKEKLNV